MVKLISLTLFIHQNRFYDNFSSAEENQEFMAKIDEQNRQIQEMQQIAKITEEENREEQKRIFEEYQLKVEEEAQIRQAEMQDTVDEIIIKFDTTLGQNIGT